MSDGNPMAEPVGGEIDWASLSAALDRALDLPAESRERWLEELARTQPALASRVRSLLGAGDAMRRQGFLDGQAIELDPAAAVLDPAGTRLGPFELETVIGRGGMGAVWRARRIDGQFEQLVAIKLLSTPWFDAQSQARFRREVKLLSRLDHVNIGRLIDAGLGPANQPYLVLEYIAGERLDEHCSKFGLDVEARLALFLQLCSAVAYAHRQLIVHRDIKPSNVLVTADGVPKLLDFGIARLLDDPLAPTDATRLTQSSPMTPGYAAPEQLLGEEADTSTDTYQLGILLHELLTGRRPFERQGQSAEAGLQARLRDELPPASSLPGVGREVRGDLDRIVAKALRYQRAERYASAAELAADVRRHLAHEPIVARAPTFAYRAGKFLRRYRRGVALVTVALLAVAVGAIGALTQARAARLESERATRELGYARATHELLTQLLQQGTGHALTTPELLAPGESWIDEQFAGDPLMRARLQYALAEQYGLLGQPQPAQVLLRKAYASAATDGDPSLKAHIACDLGESLAYSGQLAAAFRIFDETIARLGAPERQADLANCLASRANGYEQDGASARALADLQRALQLYERDETVERRALLNVRISLAWSLSNAGKAAASAEQYGTVMAELESLRLDRTAMALKVLNNWGLMFLNAGQLTQAESVFERARELFKDIDSGQVGDPAVFGNSARLLTELGRNQDALPLFARAMDLAEKNQLLQWLAVLPIYEAQARINLGDLNGAEALLQASAPRLAALYHGENRHFATLALRRGRLAMARGDAVVARRHYLEAVAIGKRVGVGAAVYTIPKADGALAALQVGDLDAATAEADEAVALATGALEGYSSSMPLGAALLAKSLVLKSRGHRSEAATLARQALLQLEASAGPDAAATRRAALEAGT
jgi:tetratricopeptide (TPR) repeat protein